MFRVYAALVLALSVLAGCSSVEASTPKSTAATPSLPCSLPYGTHVALVSPAPGSASAAAAGTPVVVVSSRDLPKTTALVVTDAEGTTSAPLERTLRPPHAAPAAFANPVYYRATGLALKPHRHYTVALDDVAQNGCAPYAPHRRQRPFLHLRSVRCGLGLEPLGAQQRDLVEDDRGRRFRATARQRTGGTARLRML